MTSQTAIASSENFIGDIVGRMDVALQSAHGSDGTDGPAMRKNLLSLPGQQRRAHSNADGYGSDHQTHAKIHTARQAGQNSLAAPPA